MFEGLHNSPEDRVNKAEELSNEIINRFNETDSSTWITEAEATTIEAAGDPLGVLENEKVAGRYPHPAGETEFKKAA